MNEKQQILATVNTLPDNATLEDAIYALYLKLKIKQSENDIKNDRVMTVEESIERMRKKHEGFNI